MNDQNQNQNQPVQSADNGRLASILAYIPPLWLIGLLGADKDKPNVKFHVNQGLLLTICLAAGSIVSAILGFIFGMLNLSFISLIISLAIWVVGILLAVKGIMNAMNDKQEPLPLIGKLFTIIK